MQQQQMTKRELRRQKQQEKQARREAAAQKQKQRRMITWGVSVAVIALIIFGLAQTGSDGPSVDTTENPMLITSEDHIKGNPDTYVTLVEYSDFQCPACRSFYPVLKQLNETFPDRLRIVYRHFPLVQIHPYAARAARAAEAAGMQGKFWEMHDLIFDTQSDWSSGGSPKQFFTELAGTLGLDTEQFERDMDGDVAQDKVTRDRNSGTKLGVSGTPTFYLNGRKITNPGSLQEFTTLIQEAIENTPTVEPLLETAGGQFRIGEGEQGEVQLEPGDEAGSSPTSSPQELPQEATTTEGSRIFE